MRDPRPCGHAIRRPALSPTNGPDADPGRARSCGDAMYHVFYWAGVATLIVWTAYSAYSTIIGH
jgi:hypothetical protein